jgi:hypothetical protein
MQKAFNHHCPAAFFAILLCGALNGCTISYPGGGGSGPESPGRVYSAPPPPMPVAAAPPPEPAPAPAPLPAPVPSPSDATTAEVNKGIPDSSKLSWNVWLSRNEKLVESINASGQHRVNLSLSGSEFENFVRASPAVTEAITAAVAESGYAKLRIRATILGAGGAVGLDDGALMAQTLKVNRATLQKISTRNAVDDAPVEMSRESKFEKMRTDSLLKMSFPLMAKGSTPTCAQVAYSIWDESDSRPLDHIVFSFPVNAGPERYDELCGVPKVQGGIGTMAGALSSHGTARANAALFLFEYNRPYSPLRTRAILVDVGGNDGENAVFNWDIAGSPAPRISSPAYQQMIVHARSSENYDAVSKELVGALFPADVPEAQAALAQLNKLDTADGEATVLARYIKVDGTYAYLPLGLLNLHPDIKTKLAFVAPLERERYAAACFKPWTYVYPTVLVDTNGTHPLDWDEPTMKPKDMEVTLLRDMPSFSSFMNPAPAPTTLQQVDATAPSPGEGLLLLSHHSQGKVSFSSAAGAQGFKISTAQRKFVPGSVAVMNACSVASASDDHDVTLRHLNKIGVDAIVGSPFQVNSEYGRHLSRAFIEVVAETYNARESPTLRKIFDLAAAKVVEKTGLTLYQNMKYEFLILGDHNISVCPFKDES